MSERSDVSVELAGRLRRLGVALDGRESGEELMNLLDAIEAFEQSVQRHGGDLMVDEPVNDKVSEPDDRRFVLPKREGREAIVAFTLRVREATAAIAHHRKR